MEVRISRLESIFEQMAETVIATSETVDRLTERIDALSYQAQEQAKQVEQQGYQILALGNALQTLAENQEQSLERLAYLTETLERLMAKVGENKS